MTRTIRKAAERRQHSGGGGVASRRGARLGAQFFVLFAAGLSCSVPASAAVTDSQIWTTAGLNVTLSPQWRFSEELVGRFSDNRDGLYEIESSSMIGYRPTKAITIAGGYVYDPQYLRGDLVTTEHRLREQVSYDGFASLGKAKLSARLRAEQRWRTHVDGTGWRLRPYVKLAVPVAGKLSLNLSNETFVNLNRTAFQKQTGIDRMRNLVSLSLPLSKQLTGEAGYMNQHGFVRGGRDTSDNIAYFAVSLSI